MKKLLPLLFYILPTGAYSQISPLTDENLFHICKDIDMACRAFIVAVIDTTILIDTVDQIDCSIFKILKGTILTQIKDIIFGGLTNNPKRQQERVVFSVISILRSTFPCYSSQSK